MGSVTVDQLVSTFSSEQSLIAFAQLCCDPSWTTRADHDFQEICLQVLFECVSKDRPALLQGLWLMRSPGLHLRLQAFSSEFKACTCLH